MGRQIKKGSTDQSIDIFIGDTSTGAGKTGLVYNTSGLSMWYHRTGAAKTSITLATLSALTDAHSDGGFKEIGDGHYRLDVPDAAFATGVNEVRFGGAATGGVVIPTSNHLVDYDPQDATALGVSRIDASISSRSSLDAGGVRTAVGLTAANLDSQLSAIAGYIDTEIAAIKSKTDNLPSDPADASDIAAAFVKIRKYLQLIVRKDAAIATDNATELTEINADGGSGAGSYNNTTDSLEARAEAGYCCQFGINAKSTEGKVLQLEAWLEADGQFVDLSSVDPAATVSITLSEHGSGVVQVTAGSGEVPNAAGRFEFEYDMEAEDAGYPNLVDDRGYTAIVEITANSVTYTTVHSFAAIGGE